MSKFFDIDTPIRINGNVQTAITIRPPSAPASTYNMFQILDATSGDVIASIDYGGNITAKKITVDSLVYNETGSTQSDLSVNGSLNVAASARIGDDSASDALNIYADTKIFAGAFEGTATEIVHIDVRSATKKVVVTGDLEISGAIYEGGTLLSGKYALSGHNHDATYLKITDASSTYLKKDGSVAMTGDLEITVGGKTMTIGDGTTANEINHPDEIYLNKTNGKPVYVGQDANPANLIVSGNVTASNIMSVSTTIAAGDTTYTWTHNYGSINYSVSALLDTLDRHVAFSNKTANSIVINLDDILDNLVNVELILHGR